MGLFDRLRKSSAPAVDTLTREALARTRALPDVVDVEIVDGDLLRVTWTGGAVSDLALDELRPRWSAVKGFERITVTDDFFAGIAPPSTMAEMLPDILSSTDVVPDTTPDVAPDTAPDIGSTAPAVDEDEPGSGATVVILPRVERPSTDPGIVSWPIVDGLVATATVGGRPVTAAELGLDAATIRNRALDTLRALDPSIEPLEPGVPAWIATEPAGAVSTWLCAPDALLAATGEPELILLAPLSSELVAVEPSATAVLHEILTSTLAILDSEAGGDTLAPIPLLATHEGLRVWTPPADHPCVELVASLRERGGFD